MPDRRTPEGEKKLRRGQVWLNTRRGFKYLILGFPKWSDSPDEKNLETFVHLINVQTGVEYVRSIESFFGTNREGAPRFLKV